MEKLLTVVVPVYNTEKFLDKCLRSLIVPPYLEKLEVLVVIDGSPDHSYDVALPYEKQYPQTFRVINKENGGHGSCCNVALQEAKGKYIRFLDSDDWLDDSFSLFLDKLSSSTADAVFTRTAHEYVSEGRTRITAFPPNISEKEYAISEIDWNAMPLLLFSLAETTYRTQYLRDTDVTFREKVSYDDTVLYAISCVGLQRVAFYNQSLYHYLIGRADQSMASKNRIRKIADIQLQLLDLYHLYNEKRERIPLCLRPFVLRIIHSFTSDFCQMTLLLPKAEAKERLSMFDTLSSQDPQVIKPSRWLYVQYRILPRGWMKLYFFTRRRVGKILKTLHIKK